MPDPALEQLLERREVREQAAVVTAEVVERWTATFGDPWTGADERVVPTLMFPTFARPVAPPRPGETAPTGVVLHDALKSSLDLPVAIAVGYELELVGDLRIGERLRSEERIAALGPERSTRFGPGREWVIEVVSSVADRLVGVERFRMLGYRPEASSDAGTGASSQRAARAQQWSWSETIEVDAEWIRRSATANRVWAPAHHQSEAARRAGLADIIVDTSSQVAVMAAAAQRRHPDLHIASVDLAMKRPILPGSTVILRGRHAGRVVTVVATVEEREMSRADITFAG